MSQTSTAQGKNASGLLTLLYSGAAFSVLLSVFASVAAVGKLFTMWTNSGSGVQDVVALLAGGNVYIDTVLYAVVAAGSAAAAYFLYSRVTKEVAKDTNYLATTAYKFITNALVGILTFVLALVVFQLVTILISSLLLIGTGTDIGAMYLGEFLPMLVAASIVGFVDWQAWHIMRGHNKSKIMTLVLVGLAGAALVATLITVPIKAHGTTNTTKNTIPSLEDFSGSQFRLDDWN